MVTAITRDQLKAKLDGPDRPIVLEALPPMYYEEAHLPSALNMPHDQVDQLAPRLIPSKDSVVVVYCSNTPCQNSTIASRRLAALGYANVKEYVEGKQDWIEAGLPTARGAPAASR